MAAPDPIAVARAAGRAAGLAAPPLRPEQAERLRALVRSANEKASA